MWNLKVIIIVFILLASGLYLPADLEQNPVSSPEAGTSTAEPDMDKSSSVASPTPSPSPSPSSSSSSRAGGFTAHGGAWFDPFDDETKMDLTKSNNYRIQTSQASINKSYLIDASAAAVWHMDEGSGIYAYDATPNNNRGDLGFDGIGPDVPTWTTGQFGGALYFDGSDVVDCGRRPSLNITAELTISAWVNVDVWTTGGRIVNRYGSSNPDQGYIMWINRVGSTNYIRFGVEDPTLGFESIETLSTGDMQTDKWIHAVGVYDGSNLKMYVDGVLDNSRSTFVNSIRVANTNVYIGNNPFMSDPFWGKLDEVSIYNKALTAAEVLSLYQTGAVRSKPTANITSEQVTLPAGMKWDTININKTIQPGSFLNITIRNPVNNEIIPATPVYSDNGEFDISFIDPVLYPSIKLNASFKTTTSFSPALRSWGVSWKKANSWADSFQTSLKVDSYYNVNQQEGYLEFSNGGYIITKPIALPAKSYYGTFLISATEPDGTYFRFTAVNPLTGAGILGYQNLHGTSIDISGINPHTYSSICLKVSYTSGGGTGQLHVYSINWTQNKAPRFLDCSSPTFVYRTDSIEFSINLTDEDSESNLTLELEYQKPGGTTWYTNYLKEPFYTGSYWSVQFKPPSNAKLGIYTFQITAEDLYNDRMTWRDDYEVEVKNNLPTEPVVIITPSKPRTADNLQVTAAGYSDIETQTDSLEVWYNWYRDDVEVTEFKNSTLISEISTTKNEVWTCSVQIFDGDDLGPAGTAEVFIENIPPEVLSKPEQFELNEDSFVVMDNKLQEIFTDMDGDPLSYSASGYQNIQVDIGQKNGTISLLPAENWYGTEHITFSANDSDSQAEVIIKTIVKPTNDLPVITQVGSQRLSGPYRILDFTVKQDESLKLHVYVEDIDGDVGRGMIYFILNITETEQLYFDLNDESLIFKPDNSHVGVHYIDIAVTDNNATPLQYVSQAVRITVTNVNDPPTVEIKNPRTGIELSADAEVTFTCTSSDPDLDIPDSDEELSYRWYAQSTADIIELGRTKDLVEPKLPAGYVTITLEVTDSTGETVSDSVVINVLEPEKDTSGLSSGQVAMIAIIPIILIIVLVLFFVMRKRKKSEGEEAVQPDVVSPYTGAPAVAAPAQTVVVKA
ncbi:MAG: LamG domain-containing protein, partial [Planctomycetota bacterium]